MPEIEIGPEEMNESSEMPKEHELEMHVSDLMRAHKLKANKKLMSHVSKHMKKKSKEMSSMADECCGDMAEDGIKSISDLKEKKKKYFSRSE